MTIQEYIEWLDLTRGSERDEMEALCRAFGVSPDTPVAFYEKHNDGDLYLAVLVAGEWQDTHTGTGWNVVTEAPEDLVVEASKVKCLAA